MKTENSPRSFSIVLCSVICAVFAISLSSRAQSVLYSEHFDLNQVELLDGPFKEAADAHASYLLEYDVNRLMTPFIRQAGLSADAESKYYGWVELYPSFSNWGLDSWSLEGHVGGHYLSALALAYASTPEGALRDSLAERLEYVVQILSDCQDAYDGNDEGLRGFIGGQPINEVWTGLYADDLTAYRTYGGWVPFYCEHKVLAGLRDAYVYAGNEVALQCFAELADWAVNVVSNLSDEEMQTVLGWEHGGMNEVLADAYKLFGDEKYLDGAKRYCHQYEVDGMQGDDDSYSRTFLDGQHANTQVPKFIGFERIYQLDDSQTELMTAAENFWKDVAENRTVCIGGNSVSEHFLAQSKGSEYINNLDGPETCNTNNMLKMSELLFDRTHDAKYADFYEQAVWNHILSTRDPLTGGFVYFTTLRPQGYKIYSTINECMWCCVGTGMENHCKYGHFIYTHDGEDTLYVNLFTPSRLTSDEFCVIQSGSFPFESRQRLTIDKGGTFVLAVRHPFWAGSAYGVTVNGEAQEIEVEEGVASYVTINRTWNEGDVVEVELPMVLRYEECPNYTDYVAFKYGPILLGAKTSTTDADEAEVEGLTLETLVNEFADDSRMGHAPGSMASSKSLSSAPKIICERDEVLSHISPVDTAGLTFSVVCQSDTLTLEPFYSVHHARYVIYWYQQTEEEYANSGMAEADSVEQVLADRTIDFVATGEQQSEAGHDASYSSDSGTGNYNGETYRDAKAGGYIQYMLENPDGETENLSIGCRFTTADAGRKGYLYVDGELIANVVVPSSHADADENGFFMQEYGIPSELMTDSDGNPKELIYVRLVASSSTLCPGLYYIRLLRDYYADSNPYVFVATDWVTGDSWRIAQSNISYDAAANTITLNAGTGSNNVCLNMNYADLDYTIESTQNYLVVRGTNLKTTSGASYLWWLNGANHGTSVSPTDVLTSESTGETVVVWDMSTSGLDDYNVGSTFSICQGSTIFGLTSTTGTSVISYIGFSSSPDDSEATGVALAGSEGVSGRSVRRYYGVDGVRSDRPLKGLNIVEMTDGSVRKVVM